MHQQHHRASDRRAHMRDGAQCPTSPPEGPACTSADVLRVRPHCKSSCGNGVQSMPPLCPIRSFPSLGHAPTPRHHHQRRAPRAPPLPPCPLRTRGPTRPLRPRSPDGERERERQGAHPPPHSLSTSPSGSHARARELHAAEELPAFAASQRIVMQTTRPLASQQR